MPSNETVQRWATVFLTFIVSFTVVQRLLPTKAATPQPPPKPVACTGTPIKVNYPFEGNYIEDHACLPQCGNRQQHYVLYSNGKATQCEMLPGCNDFGEDRGLECIPPAMTTTS